VKKLFTILIYIFAAIGFVLTFGFFAVKFGLTNEKGVIDNQKNTFIDKKDTDTVVKKAENEESWKKTEDWQALKVAITKDREAIYKASALFDVKPRMIVAIIMVEQMRLFGDNRELVKTVFAPLKILGVQSQFSWGVVGIKRETAISTENYLKDDTSSFYPGKKYENLLDFQTKDTEQERFLRLTDEDNRLYSYLYTAAILKELETQWKNAGYPLNTRPEILSTLFNIGFIHSKPNKDPKSGGASIVAGGKTYSFGSLAESFYNSNELTEYFPK
jgi:hypothetical protein